MDEEIRNIKTKLREQTDNAKNQTTLGGFYNVMYGFVEIIENDPVFSLFVEKMIDKELAMKNFINQEYKAKKIDNDTWMELNALHVFNHFWHEYYSLFKMAHDVIKIGKCAESNSKATNIDELGLFWFSASNKDLTKDLTKYEINARISDCEGCYNSLLELINTNPELLNDLFKNAEKINNSDIKMINKLKLTPQTKWEDIEIKFKNDYDISIKANEQSYDSNYEKMGFADKRKDINKETKAKESWELLQLFSVNNIFPLGKMNNDEKTKRKKQKQELSKLLKNYFQINDDPIITNKITNEYMIKIKLIPEESFRSQWADRNIKTEDWQNKQYL